MEHRVLLNGEKTENFKPNSGLCQGDPLFLYLFVLGMEKLSQLIQFFVDAKMWVLVKASRNGPRVSHVFFADDLILFPEVTVDNTKLMRKCIDEFCKILGQQVSYEKSCVYISGNVGHKVASTLANLCRSPLTNDLEKYLSVPLIHDRINSDTYKYVVAKVERKLASWKIKNLSMASRITPIKAVTGSILVYVMQTAKLPAATCDKLDKRNRDFLWGHSDDQNTLHLVNWRTVTTTKKKGRLGIKSTKAMNQALLAKVGWRLHHNKEAP